MLIEQILALRGPVPPGHIYTPITGCFHNKALISKENIRLDWYLVLKYCRRQCTLLPPTWAKSLKIASKRKTEQLNFFNWLSTVKNLVLSNGSEYVQNVIQWY